ncbi:MAG: hypothetical protein V4436_00060 [Patescibacteria group bacterium]
MIDRIHLIGAMVGAFIPHLQNRAGQEFDVLTELGYVDSLNHTDPEVELGIYSINLLSMPDPLFEPSMPLLYRRQRWEREDEREEWKRLRNRGHKLPNRAHKKRS